MTRVQYDRSTSTTRNGRHLAGLDQSEQFEQFIERAEAARKCDQGVGPHCEMQLADREIMKLKGKIGRRIGVGLLLVRQSDIVADRRRAGVRGAAVRSLHDAGAAAGRDDIIADAVVREQRAAALRNDFSETPRFLVPPRRMTPDRRRGLLSRPHPRAAEDHDGRADRPGAQALFRLGIFDLQANPAHGVAEQELGIERGKAECRRVSLQAVIGHGRDPVPWSAA